MVTTVLLDTDIGNHIDDVFALVAACNSPEIRLVGVTTTGDDPALRAALARRLLDTYGASQVPVAAGDPVASIRARLSGSTASIAKACSDSGLRPSRQSAVELMRRQVESHPGITLVSTAPLTNIAELLRRHPELEGAIGRIVFMGGWSAQALPEHNLKADPEAAAAVLATSIPLVAVGYEVTLGCTLQPHFLRQLEKASGAGPQFVKSLYDAWQRDTGGKVRPVMHDPLTIAALSAPELVHVTPMRMKVRLQEGPGRGALYRHADGKSLDVCTEVHANAFLRWLGGLTSPNTADPDAASLDPTSWHIQLKEAYFVSHYAGWTNDAETGEHHIAVLVTEGAGQFDVAGQSIRLRAGSCLYVGTDKAYQIATEAGMRSYWFHFSAAVLARDGTYKSVARIPGFATHLVRPLRESQLVAQAERILTYWIHPSPEASLMCQASLLELLASWIDQEEAKPEAERTIDGAIIEAERFIQAHARKRMTLDDLSRHVGLSKYHLARKFREAYGASPLQYHTELRMQQARRLLRLKTIPVKEVAVQLGYTSLHAFSRAFRREVGVSPSEFVE